MNLWTTPTLEGRRIRLEPLSLAHVDDLVAAASEARASYRLTNVPDGREAMTRYVQTALASRQRFEAVPFATVLREGGRVIGSTRFGNLERWPRTVGGPTPPMSELPDAVEIGWTWLAASMQRTFANSEAKRLMLSHAFERWGVKRVTLKTDARNAASRRAIERLGAKLDGVLRAHMPAYDGGIRDSAVYSIVAVEWPDVRARLDATLAR